jgi:uncharacterized protein YxjI
MNELLSKNLYLVKQHLGMFKAANNFDIYCPETSDLIMTCREDKLGFLTKIFRFTNFKMMTPFHVEIKDRNNQLVLSMKRKSTFWGFTPIMIFDENNSPIGLLQRKFRIGGAKIELTDLSKNNLGTLQGNLIGWDFKITNNNTELARITKKWAGIGKELFTTADNYILVINDVVNPNEPIRKLMLSAVLCIDFLLKNK